MCRAAPARTRLFAWLMNDVEILLLADPSVHGAENAVNAMTQIDHDRLRLSLFIKIKLFQ
jgi:hypothetical protein